MANTNSKAAPSPKTTPAAKPVVAAKPSVFERAGRFLKETWVELKKTSWPSKDELVKGALLVFGALAVVGLWIGGLDFILGAVLRKMGL